MVKRLVVSGYKPHELGIYDNKNPGISYLNTPPLRLTP